MKRWTWPILVAAILVLTACGSSSTEDTTQSGSSAYYIENKGSDTLVNLALAWAERYQDRISRYPNFGYRRRDPAPASPLLINGTIDIANASRQIKDLEIDLAESAGFTPLRNHRGQ